MRPTNKHSQLSFTGNREEHAATDRSDGEDRAERRGLALDARSHRHEDDRIESFEPGDDGGQLGASARGSTAPYICTKGTVRLR